MNVDRKLLEILCCPVSKVPVTPLAGNRLEALNQAINAGEVIYVDGSAVDSPLEGALMTEDQKVIYRVDDGIPVMLAERGIGTTQLAGKVAGF